MGSPYFGKLPYGTCIRGYLAGYETIADMKLGFSQYGGSVSGWHRSFCFLVLPVDAIGTFQFFRSVGEAEDLECNEDCFVPRHMLGSISCEVLFRSRGTLETAAPVPLQTVTAFFGSCCFLEKADVRILFSKVHVKASG